MRMEDIFPGGRGGVCLNSDAPKDLGSAMRAQIRAQGCCPTLGPGYLATKEVSVSHKKKPILNGATPGYLFAHIQACPQIQTRLEA